MRKETDIIKKAKVKKGRDFDKWIEQTPTYVADISKIRAITKKLDYSMVEEASK